MMATSENVEHATLVAVSDKMVTILSADPLPVAQKLFSKGLDPPEHAGFPADRCKDGPAESQRARATAY